MNTKTTPGPWRIVRDDDGCIEIADSNGFLVTKTVARGGTVNRANANLIVAAPELLEVCKGLVESHKTRTRGCDCQSCRLIKAVIAKAEGIGSWGMPIGESEGQ